MASSLRGVGPGLLAAWLSLQLAQAVLSVLAVVSVGYVVSAGSQSLQVETAGPLIPALLLFSLALLGGQVVGFATDVATVAVKRRLVGNNRTRLRRAVGAPSGVAHLEDPAVLDKVSVAASGILGQTAEDAAVVLVSTGFRYVAAAGQAAVLVRYFWWLAVALFLIVFTVRMVLRVSAVAIGQVWADQLPALRRTWYLGALPDSAMNAKESRIFGFGAFLLRMREDSWRTAMEPIWLVRIQEMRKQKVIFVAVVAFYVGVDVLLTRKALVGALSVGAMTACIAAARSVLSMTYVGDAQTLVLGRKQLEALEAVEQIAPPTPATPARRVSRDGPVREITFDNVVFSYPRQVRPVFDGLDLTIEAGKSLSVVGVNGAGKTTLIKLLAGLHVPQAGRILVDGQDLRELDINSWRRQIAVIFQEFTRYPLSASANVSFGAVSDSPDQTALRRAAELAGTGELIESLPAGWDTVLSRAYTDGADVSGGQWQRIALARALYAVNAGARVLVLDEPTASQDARAEAELFARFLELTAGLTTILVSHRFSTVRRAERIVVLKAGQIHEDGSHQTLMAGDDGTYRKLYLLQASRYLDTAATVLQPAGSGDVAHA